MTDRHLSGQNHQRSRLHFICLTLLILLPLTACGKKPNQLDVPPGAQEDAYPRVYPDPASDPKP
jgi:hypothetical protein